MNRTHPQHFDTASFDSANSHFATQRGCCNDCLACIPCTRRCICVTTIALLILGVIAAIIALVVTVGIPPHTPVNRLCVTTSNQTGFLCDDRETCIPASQLCDTRRNCLNGEDEQKTLCRCFHYQNVLGTCFKHLPILQPDAIQLSCADATSMQLRGDVPNSLPRYLIFYCGNRSFWIYADKRCNGFNDCGDCSDEIGSWASCPPCEPERWRCMTVFYSYCDCLPRRLCQDGIQDCSDWSDEYICRR